MFCLKFVFILKKQVNIPLSLDMSYINRVFLYHSDVLLLFKLRTSGIFQQYHCRNLSSPRGVLKNNSLETKTFSRHYYYRKGGSFSQLQQFCKRARGAHQYKDRSMSLLYQTSNVRFYRTPTTGCFYIFTKNLYRT